MATWRVPALLLLAMLVAAPAAASDAKPATDAAVEKVDAKAAPASQPVKPEVEEPKTVDEAVDTAQSVFKDFKGEKYRAGVAGIITLLIFLWRRFASKFVIGKLPKGALPWVTAGVAFLAAIPVALATDPWSWKTFVWQGLITGAEAMAFWSLLGKFLLGKTLAKKEEEKPE